MSWSSIKTLEIKVFIWLLYYTTREIPGVALVNILIGWIFMGKGNTHLKWNIEVVAHVEEKYIWTRELPGIALVNILNRWIFTGKGNTHLKWNIEVAHVEEKNIWKRHNFLWNSILASAKDFSYSFHLEWMSLTFGTISHRGMHGSKSSVD